MTTPEPGSVTLPPWAVESLRERLDRCEDVGLTDQQRHQELVMLSGALAYHLHGHRTATTTDDALEDDGGDR